MYGWTFETGFIRSSLSKSRPNLANNQFLSLHDHCWSCNH